VGNPYAHADLYMLPADLLKIGELILHNGFWHGQQIISPQWLEETFSPAPLNSGCGLLWWLIPDEMGEIIGYKAHGYGGQFLVIYPEKKLIGIRLIRITDTFNQATDSFEDFADILYSLIKK
jgi:CubicO group peptidase (beta-lactamase class C family)